MIAETIEYRGFNINIHYDDDPMNSRTDWDNFGHMICFHERYTLGDKHDYQPDTFLQELACELDPSLENKIGHWESGNGWTQLLNKENNSPDFNAVAACEDIINKLVLQVINKQTVMLPLYLYDHSGITMNTTGFHCPWDSGQVGVIYATRDEILKEHGKKLLSKKLRKRVETCLQGEVEDYNNVLTGRVYGYTVEPKEANKKITCDDSCWGFFGDNGKAYAITEAKGAIDWEIGEYTKNAVEQYKTRKLQKQVQALSSNVQYTCEIGEGMEQITAC